MTKNYDMSEKSYEDTLNNSLGTSKSGYGNMDSKKQKLFERRRFPNTVTNNINYNTPGVINKGVYHQGKDSMKMEKNKDKYRERKSVGSLRHSLDMYSNSYN